MTADLSDSLKKKEKKKKQNWFLSYQYPAGVLEVAPVSGNNEQGYLVFLVICCREC